MKGVKELNRGKIAEIQVEKNEVEIETKEREKDGDMNTFFYKKPEMGN